MRKMKRVTHKRGAKGRHKAAMDSPYTPFIGRKHGRGKKRTG